MLPNESSRPSSVTNSRSARTSCLPARRVRGAASSAPSRGGAIPRAPSSPGRGRRRGRGLTGIPKIDELAQDVEPERGAVREREPGRDQTDKLEQTVRDVVRKVARVVLVPRP